MAGSLNKAMLIGNLGADPEIRNTKAGKSVASFRIATSESWKDKESGERKETTEWHNVVVFNEGLAKVIGQYGKKGMKVYVEGQLQTQKWKDKEGVDRYTTNIVLQGFGAAFTFLDKPVKSDGDEEPAPKTSKANTGGGKAPLDDEIPFAPM